MSAPLTIPIPRTIDLRTTHNNVLYQPIPEIQTPPLSPSTPSLPPSPAPGSSCHALREAVTHLTRWDDFMAEFIGEGISSRVYKVRHLGTGAVHVIKLSKNLDRRNQRKFVQELELLNKLKHPNVIQYIGACVKDGHLHPLLEYVPGGNLEDVLANHQIELSWQQKAHLASDVAAGMSYLHTRNICHRDLKSENCLVRNLDNDRLQVVVADFGLARILSKGLVPLSPVLRHRYPLVDLLETAGPVEEGEAESPRKMSCVGTAYWMAPEILRGEEYTRKVDVFSYGILLCEIIARVEADPDILPRTQVFGLNLEAFRRIAGDCPEALMLLADVCCTMDAPKRPTFVEIGLRLRNIQNSLSTDITQGTEQSFEAPDKQNEVKSEDGLAGSSTVNQLEPIDEEAIRSDVSSRRRRIGQCTALPVLGTRRTETRTKAKSEETLGLETRSLTTSTGDEEAPEFETRGASNVGDEEVFSLETGIPAGNTEDDEALGSESRSMATNISDEERPGLETGSMVTNTSGRPTGEFGLGTRNMATNSGDDETLGLEAKGTVTYTKDKEASDLVRCNETSTADKDTPGLSI